MVQVPERRSKLSPKFIGPRLVIRQLHGNKFEVFDPSLKTLEIIHSDRLKRTQAKTELGMVDTADLADAVRLDSTSSSTINTHNYNPRSRK